MDLSIVVWLKQCVGRWVSVSMFISCAVWDNFVNESNSDVLECRICDLSNGMGSELFLQFKRWKKSIKPRLKLEQNCCLLVKIMNNRSNFK